MNETFVVSITLLLVAFTEFFDDEDSKTLAGWIINILLCFVLVINIILILIDFKNILKIYIKKYFGRFLLNIENKED